VRNAAHVAGAACPPSPYSPDACGQVTETASANAEPLSFFITLSLGEFTVLKEILRYSIPRAFGL
jgi:hypothetical protein